MRANGDTLPRERRNRILELLERLRAGLSFFSTAAVDPALGIMDVCILGDVRIKDVSARERLRAAMSFGPSAGTMKTEFGYWAGAIRRRASEGMLERVDRNVMPLLELDSCLAKFPIDFSPRLPERVQEEVGFMTALCDDPGLIHRFNEFFLRHAMEYWGGDPGGGGDRLRHDPEGRGLPRRPLERGGYVPHEDHAVPVDVAWEDFVYYRNRLNDMIDGRKR